MSEDPRDRRTRCGACLRFTDPEGRPRVVLIDCPPDHREHALRLDLDRCDTILLTHAHVDHVFGLDDVRRYNAVQKSDIEVLAEPAVPRRNGADVPPRLPPARERQRLLRGQARHALVAPGWRSIATACGSSLRLLHGRLPILGYRIDALDDDERGPGPARLLLARLLHRRPGFPETAPARGARTLVLDMLRPRAHPTHFTVDEAVEAASRSGPSGPGCPHVPRSAMRSSIPAPGDEAGLDGLRL